MSFESRDHLPSSVLPDGLEHRSYTKLMGFRVDPDKGGYHMHFDQGKYGLRCEWGLEGLSALQSTADAVVIVDVLSFSTAVDVALSRGASVLPYRWKDASAARFAAENGAVLASARSDAGPYTLSPASFESIPAGIRVVLPSPNGSAIAASTRAIPVFTACLRNAPAVARRASACGPRIAVIPAGERWRTGTLRPCLEDLIGAGAVLAELPGPGSPEAEMAVAVFECFRRDLGDALLRCGSGEELVQRGFSRDVELAAEYAVSRVAPSLQDGAFVDGA
jgi:2-phosphosulfolactate phosphatase